MKPYASYKPSGVPWLGDVPRHWEVNTIKRGYEITLGKMLQTEQKASTDVSAPYLRSANVQSERVDVSDVQTMWFSEHEVHQLALEPNDLVVCEGGDAGRSAIWHGEIDGCYFQNSVNRVRGVYNNTTFYLMRWLGVVKSCGYMDIVCNKATIAHLTKEKLANLPMLFPPPDEQQAIADYLDAETARIDTLIDEKDELIGLLREWRQSVIAETVTKGLNKTVATKPSGLPWLGDIPSHWDAVGMTKKIASIVDYRGKTPEKVDQGVFLVTAKNIREGFIDYEVSQEFVSVDDYEEVMRRGKPDIGDVLFTTEAPLGNVALVDRTDIALAQRVIKFKGIPQTLDNSFLMYWLLSRYMQEQLSSWSSGSTAEGIKSGRLVRLPLALPPFDEQQAIADYLDTETSKIDDLIVHTNDEITLLKELRAATIADAVLGRIDVRTIPLACRDTP